MTTIQALVDRFLAWPVPASVYPDGTPGQPGRTGTNLLSASEARQLLEHLLGTSVRSWVVAQQHPTLPEVSIFLTSHEATAQEYKRIGWTVLPVDSVAAPFIRPVPAAEEWSTLINGTRLTFTIGHQTFEVHHRHEAGHAEWMQRQLNAALARLAAAPSTQPVPAHVEPTTERFQQTSCSQCGRDLGPGPCGISHCSDHATPEALAAAWAPYRATFTPKGSS